MSKSYRNKHWKFNDRGTYFSEQVKGLDSSARMLSSTRFPLREMAANLMSPW